MLKFLSGVLVGLLLAAAVIGAVVFLAPEAGLGTTQVTKSKSGGNKGAAPASTEAAVEP